MRLYLSYSPSFYIVFPKVLLLGDGYLNLHIYIDMMFRLLVKNYGFTEIFSRNIAKVLNKRFRKLYRSKSHNRWGGYYRS